MKTKSLHIKYNKSEVIWFDNKLCNGCDLEEEKKTKK